MANGKENANFHKIRECTRAKTYLHDGLSDLFVKISFMQTDTFDADYVPSDKKNIPSTGNLNERYLPVSEVEEVHNVNVIELPPIPPDHHDKEYHNEEYHDKEDSVEEHNCSQHEAIESSTLWIVHVCHDKQPSEGTFPFIFPPTIPGATKISHTWHSGVDIKLHLYL